MDHDQNRNRTGEAPANNGVGPENETRDPGVWQRYLDGWVDDFFDALEALGSFQRRITGKLLPHRHSHRMRRRRSRRSSEESYPATAGHLPPRQNNEPPAHALPQQAEGIAKGPASAEHSKFSGIRPIQGKETVTRLRNVLIVGGMDFFGAALVRQLNAVDFREITVTDSLSDGVCRRLLSLNFREFLTPEEFGEIAEARFRALPDFSHIFYLGGWRPETIASTKSLLLAANRSGARFIAVAPASSMGAAQTCPAEARRDPQNFRPRTQEGLLSCLFDRYAFSKSPGKNFLSLKYFQLFGRGENRDGGLGGLVEACFSQIRSTGGVTLPAALAPDQPEGCRRFDFLPVDDAARIALFLAQNHMTEGVFEIGSGAAATPGELVQAVVAATGGTAEITWDETLSYSPPPQGPECACLDRVAECGWKSYARDLAANVVEHIAGRLEKVADAGWDETPHSPESFKKSSRPLTPIPQKKRHAE